MREVYVAMILFLMYDPTELMRAMQKVGNFQGLYGSCVMHI